VHFAVADLSIAIARTRSNGPIIDKLNYQVNTLN
jgi:hypothetical protein